MLDEFTKALGPWPILQLLFGVLILAGGAWAIYRGTMKNTKDGPVAEPSKKDIEELRQEWEAYQQLGRIDLNSGMIVRQLEHLNEAIRQLTAALWNQRQPPPH